MKWLFRKLHIMYYQWYWQDRFDEWDNQIGGE